MDKVKICKNCKFYVDSSNYDLCSRTSLTLVDPVRGRKRTIGESYCRNEREATVAGDPNTTCGPDGQFFEEVSLITKIIRFLR